MMYVTLLVLAAILIALLFDLASSDMVFGAALVVLLFAGVISPDEALAGFANKGMITVGLLFIVSQAVQNTGVFQTIADRFLKGGRGTTRLAPLMLRIMAPVTLLSAFLNNTPIVTIFTPVVRRWAVGRGLAPGKFLIPLSYAAIFGGVSTLIGTSTNLVVHGLALDAGLAGFGFFELARIGVPITLIGYLYLTVVGPRLLPGNRDLMDRVDTNPREYFMEMSVEATSPLVGKTIHAAGLRNIAGIYLTDIERDASHIGPVGPDEVLHAGDRLLFVGKTDSVSSVVSVPGLAPVDQEQLATDSRTVANRLVEVVVSHTSPAIGRTIKEYNFRSVYNASVIAVSRNGARVEGRLGDVRLQAGDTLVLLAQASFGKRWRDSQHFYLISRLEQLTPEARGKGWLALTVVAAMVLLAAVGQHLPPLGGAGGAGHRPDMFYAAAGAAFLLLLTRVIRPAAARNAIRWDVLITIAAAFGVSKALMNSGLAHAVANGLVGAMSPFGVIGALIAVYLATTVFTELITNNAAAALMFPIALATAERVGSSPMTFLVAVAVAASASFATPIGYQTNLIVQGAGGYRFSDFVRIGLPLNVLVGAVALTAIVLWYGV
ncbi:MAG: SLC13 family permease [Spirochaeta sp.]|nr:SLC13 family permease [Spirochaeta sp.]